MTVSGWGLVKYGVCKLPHNGKGLGEGGDKKEGNSN